MEKVENLSLAKIVTLLPDAAPVLERFNLDFCCRGKQTLSEALKDDSDKLLEVTKELNILFNENDKNAQENFDEMSLSELVNHIFENHHRYVKEFSPVIFNHVKKIAEKHGGRHPELLRIAELFTEIKSDMDQHMMKEEGILFPGIKQIESQSKNGNGGNGTLMIETPINVMEEEHEIVGEKLFEIRELSNNYTVPDDACVTYRLAFDELKNFEHDLHQHVHLENYILFPKAIEMQRKLYHSNIII